MKNASVSPSTEVNLFASKFGLAERGVKDFQTLKDPQKFGLFEMLDTDQKWKSVRQLTTGKGSSTHDVRVEYSDSEFQLSVSCTRKFGKASVGVCQYFGPGRWSRLVPIDEIEFASGSGLPDDHPYGSWMRLSRKLQQWGIPPNDEISICVYMRYGILSIHSSKFSPVGEKAVSYYDQKWWQYRPRTRRRFKQDFPRHIPTHVRLMA